MFKLICPESPILGRNGWLSVFARFASAAWHKVRHRPHAAHVEEDGHPTRPLNHHNGDGP